MDTKSNEKTSKSESIRSGAPDIKVDDGTKNEEAGVMTISSEIEGDPETLRQLVRKIDRCLLPFMMITEMLHNIDATSLGYAAVWGMREDLHLSTNTYTWVSSMLFFGYMICEWPMGLVAQHWHTGRVVGAVVTAWGLCMMSAALCTNFGGFATQRFFLGALQSVINPAWVLMTSIFYKRDEQAFRIVFWWSMNGVSLAVGGMLSFGCGYIQVANIPSWKWIYIIDGLLTVIWGMIVFLYVPTSPQTAKWLTPAERVMAVNRLASNKTGTKNSAIKMYQIIEALDPRKDPQGLMLFLLIFFNEFVNGGFSAFFAPNLAALGYSQLVTSLLGIPVGAAQVFWMVGAAAFTLKYKNVRITMAMLALIPAFIGFLLQIAIADGQGKVAKTVGVCLSLGYCATCALSFQLPAQNAGGFTKRTTMTSIAFLGYSLGNIIGPHVFYEGQTPKYLTGIDDEMKIMGHRRPNRTMPPPI
ncbi:hypothetical protein N0V93_008998 [Gnomoniopsis smithogilvyi]|uniref:Allantoate permease n=1 Tax=Gnomoniopsis smithogilvyi TaxID=1191159 RepID=A0A9W8YJL9_9PEZI|nr:hypothetical protein N0V93_008998 [Gnomoniopsis smithogilvyi]